MKKLPFNENDIKLVLDWAEQNLQECLEIIGEVDLNEDEQDEVDDINGYLHNIDQMRKCLGLFPDLVYLLLNEELYQDSNLDEADTRWKNIRSKRAELVKLLKKTME